MKKKLLFIMPNMHIGGSVRNLLSLVSLLDPDEYDTKLLLFSTEGALLDQIPDYVQVEELPQVFRDFVLPWKESLQKLVRYHPWAAVKRVFRILYGFMPSFRRNISQKEWMFLRTLLPKRPDPVDAVVGFLQTVSIYYAAEKVYANTKIGFIRNEYTHGGYDPRYDDPYFKQMDYLGAVSRAGVEDLKQVFPQYDSKIRLVPNVVSPDFCRRMAKIGEDPFIDKSCFHLVSLGRLVAVKGFDLAVEALQILKKEGLPVIWHIIGSGPEMLNLKKQAEAAGISDSLVLAGEKANPYPYVQAADLYVQTSRSEGWCISLQEAMVLGKAVVTTDFPTAFEQVENQVTGVICNMSGKSIAEAVKSLYEQPEMRRTIEENTRRIQWCPESSLQAFFDMIQP